MSTLSASNSSCMLRWDFYQLSADAEGQRKFTLLDSFKKLLDSHTKNVKTWDSQRVLVQLYGLWLLYNRGDKRVGYIRGFEELEKEIGTYGREIPEDVARVLSGQETMDGLWLVTFKPICDEMQSIVAGYPPEVRFDAERAAGFA